MICIIPMRSGSKRLKDKNIKEFNGWPIFHYPLQTAHRSGLFTKIVIAADKEYIELIRRYMPLNTIVYERKPENSRDESGLIDLIKEMKLKFDDRYACILYATSVLTNEYQLKMAEKILCDYDCVFPVVHQNHELTSYCGYYVYEDDVSKYAGYCHADAFFMFDIKTVLREGKIIQDEYNGNGYIELKDYEAQPIHTEEDFEALKIKYRGLYG